MRGPGRGGRVVEVRQPRTLDSYRRTLRAALAAAVRRGLVPLNVAEGRIEALPAIGRADTAWWQPAEVGAFLDSVQGDRLVGLFEVAAFAGLRRGELCGLRWSDVDLAGDVPGLVVSQTLGSLSGLHDCPGCGGQHAGRRFKPRPKTDAGRRWVPLVGTTVRELLAHQAAQASEHDEFGEAYSDHDLVFCLEDGTPFNPDVVTKRFEDLADAVRFPEDAGRPDEERRRLPRIRLHDMRHGAASLLLAAGVPVEMVAMMLGSVCRRQGSDTIARLVARLGELDILMHGFGVKTLGLGAYSRHLYASDSMAWSRQARWERPLPGHETRHKNCANCLEYALAWRDGVLGRVGAGDDRGDQLELWEAAS